MSIDYGHGRTNINPDTGIRYGVISMNSLDPDMLGDFDALPNPLIAAAHADYAREQLQALAAKNEITADDLDLDDPTMALSEAIAALEDQAAIDALEAVDLRAYEHFFFGVDSDLDGCEGEIDGVHVRVFELGGALHLFVFSSPHTDHFAFCSPCIPGAGNLDSPDPSGPLTYDVPPDWRAAETN